jgi:hypothetical protein
LQRDRHSLFHGPVWHLLQEREEKSKSSVKTVNNSSNVNDVLNINLRELLLYQPPYIISRHLITTILVKLNKQTVKCMNKSQAKQLSPRSVLHSTLLVKWKHYIHCQILQVYGIGNLEVCIRARIAELTQQQSMGWMARVQFLADAKLLSFPKHPDQLWAPPNLLSNGTRGSFNGAK